MNKQTPDDQSSHSHWPLGVKPLKLRVRDPWAAPRCRWRVMPKARRQNPSRNPRIATDLSALGSPQGPLHVLNRSFNSKNSYWSVSVTLSSNRHRRRCQWPATA